MARGFLGSKDAIVGVAGAIAIIILGLKVGKGVSSALSSTGAGVKDLFSGAGGALGFSGMGVYELGRGAGSGIEYLGQGVGMGVAGLGVGTGKGISSVGGGIQAIGEGSGYAISGANVQDIVQTLRSGGEASTYKQSSSRGMRDTPTENVTIQETQDAGIMPTALGTMGLKPYSPIGVIGSWLISKTASKFLKPKTDETATPTITGGAVSSSSSSDAGTSQTSSVRSSKSTSDAVTIGGTTYNFNEGYKYTSDPIRQMSIREPISSPTPTPSIQTETKKWYNPFSWF